MKANQRFVNGDDAVSPVIAVILMVAITVVLAATVYLWVSGFGSNQANVVQASFAARAVDLPSVTGGPTVDTDSSDDAIEITYTSGQSDFSQAEVQILIDGVQLAGQTSGSNGFSSTAANPMYCTNLPAGATMASGFSWTRGSSVFLWKANAVCGTAAASPGLTGTHLLKVVAKNQVVLDTSIEVHDFLG